MDCDHACKLLRGFPFVSTEPSSPGFDPRARWDAYAIDRIYDASKKIAYDDCLLIFEVADNPYLGAAQDETVRHSFLKAFAPM